VLRVLHPESFHDDPTRALRAARYAARFGFDLEPVTADLLAGVDLSSVSSERVGAELMLMAGEKEGLKALALVSQWGLLDIEPERLELATDALDLADPIRGRAPVSARPGDGSGLGDPGTCLAIGSSPAPSSRWSGPLSGCGSWWRVRPAVPLDRYRTS
jgi:hypothetical protein